MSTKAVIGDWYLGIGNEDPFEVVAVDEELGTIDVQYFDGSIDEFDLDTWDEMETVPCAPPEDVSGIYEMEFGEFDDTDESSHELDEYGQDGLQIYHESDFKHSANY